MSKPNRSLSARRVVVSLTRSVRERIDHELDVPADVPDEEISEWAIAQADAGVLPPAVREFPPTLLSCDARATVVSTRWFDPGELPSPPPVYQVHAGEQDGALALRFTTPDERSLTLTGLTGAQLTYEWIRAGEEGETSRRSPRTARSRPSIAALTATHHGSGGSAVQRQGSAASSPRSSCWRVPATSTTASAQATRRTPI